MTIKEFLRDIGRKMAIIDMLDDQIGKLRSMAEYKGSAIDPNQGSHGSRNPHSTEDIWVKVADISIEMDRKKMELAEAIAKATEMISSLKDEKTLIIFRKRYLELKTWERIADEMDITFQWVHQLHKRGLIELSQRYPDFS